VSLQSVADDAVANAEIASAAVFVVPHGNGPLEVGAAAGISGVALDRLVLAVRDPDHPIARTVEDRVASFDVTPTAPGGPALRSHLPIFGAGGDVTGVVAVAHDATLDRVSRDRLTALAKAAGAHIE
jgi:hypothetical protein